MCLCALRKVLKDERKGEGGEVGGCFSKDRWRLVAGRLWFGGVEGKIMGNGSRNPKKKKKGTESL